MAQLKTQELSKDKILKILKTNLSVDGKCRSDAVRLNCKFRGKLGMIVLDQLAVVDKTQFVKRISIVSPRLSDKCRMSLPCVCPEFTMIAMRSL